ncbi:hypothetical protein BJY00DRAFT_313956 [Aspergillus carlsbadensis]|nr:hypothetical protein BJY00DRAFT_313956 [Aspergillus carlsbadensis]
MLSYYWLFPKFDPLSHLKPAENTDDKKGRTVEAQHRFSTLTPATVWPPKQSPSANYKSPMLSSASMLLSSPPLRHISWYLFSLDTAHCINQAPRAAMQHPSNDSQWVPRQDEEQYNPHASAAQHSVPPIASQRLPAASSSQQVPIFLTSHREMPPYFPLGPANGYDPAPRSRLIPTRYDTSQHVSAQPTPSASSVSDGSPDFLGGQGDPIDAGEPFGFYVTDRIEPPLQEREDWRPGYVSYPPPSGQSPL